MNMESLQLNRSRTINSDGNEFTNSDNIPESFRSHQPYDQGNSMSSLDQGAEQSTDEGEDNDAASIHLTYANEKRFQDFHALFRSVPEDEKLIEAFSEITAIEKKFTAFVIPNAISIVTTTNTKGHFFASFLSREAAYDLLMAAWRKSFPCPANTSALENNIYVKANASIENNIYAKANRSSVSLNGDDDDDDAASFVSARPASITKRERRRRGSSGTWTADEIDTNGGADFDSKSTHNNTHRHPKRAAVRKILKEVIGPGKHGGDPYDGRRRDSTGQGPLKTTDGASTTPQNITGLEPGGQASGGGSSLNHLPTICKCSKDGRHYPTTFMTEVYPGSVENMWKLLFESDFNKTFLTNEVMKGADVQEDPWVKSTDGNMSKVTRYTKWLGMPIGPKTTKATLTDVCEHKDYDDYVTDVTTTSTPDVPSGGSFTTKVRTCITWAGSNKVKVVVSGGVEFTKSSWIKGQIEKGAAEGMTTHYKELDKSIRKYISEHPTDFGSTGAPATEESQTSTVQSPVSNDKTTSGADMAKPSDAVAPEKTLAPAAVQSEKRGLLSTITDMLPSIEGEGLSQYALVAVLVIIMIANIHIWFQISSVTSQIEKVHVDVLNGQQQQQQQHQPQQDRVVGPKPMYKDSEKPNEESFTREQEEAMWAWLTEREERHRQYQRATERDWAQVQKNDESGKDGSDENNDSSKSDNGDLDFSLAEERLQARINDLQEQLEALERSLESSALGM
ncbi:hypothetical protein BGX20_003924 [Mortierella sp. AD010]|nr:hypothetical protein BGX20_003924 [Mortierella sp. AD010]